MEKIENEEEVNKAAEAEYGEEIDGADEVTEEEQDTIEPDTFYVRSSQGVSINGVGFCRGRYKLGQLVGIMTIDKDIMNNILSLDSASIATNPHLAM